MKSINNPIGIYYHDESRIVISKDKWRVLVHKNIPAIENAYRNNNKILISLQKAIEQDFYSMNSFHSDVKTHLSLITQMSVSIQQKLGEILTKPKRTKRDLIGRIGSIFKAITANLDAADG